MSESILIVSFKLLGDIIVQTPAIRSIKKTYPSCKLSVLIDERFQDVLVGNPYVDEILTYPLSKYKKSNFLNKFFLITALLFKLKNYRFQKVLLMDRTSLGCILSFFSGAKIRIGLKNQSLSFLLSEKVKVKEGSMDYIEFYNLLAKPLGIHTQDRRTELYFDSNKVRLNKAKLDEFFPHKTQLVSIHLGASREDKRWPAAQYSLFIEETLKNNPQIGFIIMTGPQEGSFIEDLFSYLNMDLRKHILNVGEVYIQELSSYFYLSHLVICHDSASRHVAAAFKKKTIVLMNNWNLKNWKLYSEKEGQYVVTPEGETHDLYNIKNIHYKVVADKVIYLLSVS